MVFFGLGLGLGLFRSLGLGLGLFLSLSCGLALFLSFGLDLSCSHGLGRYFFLDILFGLFGRWAG